MPVVLQESDKGQTSHCIYWSSPVDVLNGHHANDWLKRVCVGLITQNEADSYTVADALASLSKLYVLRGHAWPLTFRQEVCPPPFPASSLCFNEAPGRFWKALELNAVHPFQTAASSLGPREPQAKPGSASLPPGCSSPDRDYSFSRCHDTHATRAAPNCSASGQLQARPSWWIPEPCRELDSSTRRRTPAGPRGAHNIKHQEINGQPI